MTTKTKLKTKNIKRPMLHTQDAPLNKWGEAVEDRSFGYMMKTSEKEKNIPISKAKKILRG